MDIKGLLYRGRNNQISPKREVLFLRRFFKEYLIWNLSFQFGMSEQRGLCRRRIPVTPFPRTNVEIFNGTPSEGTRESVYPNYRLAVFPRASLVPWLSLFEGSSLEGALEGVLISGITYP